MTIHQNKAAAIDLGSNTFRLLVADSYGAHFSVLEKRMATVRLGHNLEKNELLHDDSMAKGLEVLRAFRERLDHFRPQKLRVCGTEALRRALNSGPFLQKAENILNTDIDILNGEQEARLSFVGALSGSAKAETSPLLLVDAGGSSTELIFKDASDTNTRTASISSGVVGLTEKFIISAQQPDLTGIDALLTEKLGNALDTLGISAKQTPALILGCGGSATSMAALDLKLASYNESLVHGHILQAGAMEKLCNGLLSLTAKERNDLPCLGDGRGEILPAGIRIYQILLKLLQQDTLQVSDTGLLEGILLSCIAGSDI